MYTLKFKYIKYIYPIYDIVFLIFKTISVFDSIDLEFK